MREKTIAVGREAKERLEQIKFIFRAGEFTYDEALLQARLPLKHLNDAMRIISSEHGFKHRNVTFAQFIR